MMNADDKRKMIFEVAKIKGKILDAKMNDSLNKEDSLDKILKSVQNLIDKLKEQND